jgi:hypothetical protein
MMRAHVRVSIQKKKSGHISGAPLNCLRACNLRSYDDVRIVQKLTVPGYISNPNIKR